MVVLVAAASKHGGTYEIAERIGHDLAEHGVPVDVKPMSEIHEVGGYDAFVIGSAIYFGTWMKEARAFVDGHAAELRRHPTWLFASGSIVGDPPPPDDPNALRPRLAERLVQGTGAREHKLFAGRVDVQELNVLERAAVRATHAGNGDYRDWEEIDHWADTIARAITDAGGTG